MRFNPTQSLLLAALAFTTSGAGAQRISLQYLGQNEGLGNLSLTALAQDPSGYLWVGTENGLFRYNGAEFRRYGSAQGMEDTFVTALHSSPAGALWVGNHAGLYRLRQGRLAPVLWQGRKLPVWPFQPMAEGPGGETLLASEGQLLVLSAQGDGTAVRQYFGAQTLSGHPELKSIRSIHVDGQGTLWMACKESLCQSSGSKIRILGEGEGLPRDEWASIASDKEGNLWIRSAQRIHMLPRGAARFEDRSPPDGKMRKHMLRSELHVDDSGYVLTN